jgi:hypothetical protein
LQATDERLRRECVHRDKDPKRGPAVPDRPRQADIRGRGAPEYPQFGEVQCGESADYRELQLSAGQHVPDLLRSVGSHRGNQSTAQKR